MGHNAIGVSRRCSDRVARADHIGSRGSQDDDCARAQSNCRRYRPVIRMMMGNSAMQWVRAAMSSARRASREVAQRIATTMTTSTSSSSDARPAMRSTVRHDDPARNPSVTNTADQATPPVRPFNPHEISLSRSPSTCPDRL